MMENKNRISGFISLRNALKILPLLNILLFMNHFAGAQSVPLYKTVPNSKTNDAYREKADTGTDGVIRISKVSIPSITIFKPVKTATAAPAVVICPGGGYSILAYNLEGTDIATQMQQWGVCAIVLKCRLPSDEIMLDKSIGPLQDAQRALQWVRGHAKELNINPDKVGIMGFSAGGHVAATASTHFDTAVIENKNQVSLRPDYSILCYPVISFSDAIGHRGSRDNLIGKNPSEEKINWFSNEKQVHADTPPAFLMLAADDKTVNPENSIEYFQALKKAKVPAELHIFENGGHGFGLKKNNWMPLLEAWMKNNHYL